VGSWQGPGTRFDASYETPWVMCTWCQKGDLSRVVRGHSWFLTHFWGDFPKMRQMGFRGGMD